MDKYLVIGKTTEKAFPSARQALQFYLPGSHPMNLANITRTLKNHDLTLTAINDVEVKDAAVPGIRVVANDPAFTDIAAEAEVELNALVPSGETARERKTRLQKARRATIREAQNCINYGE